MYKYLNALVKKEAASLLSPPKLGVGVKGGCEIIMHSVITLIDIYINKSDLSFLSNRQGIMGTLINKLIKCFY